MARNQLPDNSVAQRQLATAKAVMTLVPYFGGSAAEAFAAILQPKIQKRRDEWFQAIADDLDKLIARVDQIELQKLREDDRFVTALLNASQSVLRDHSVEKREALKNAVLNVAAGIKLEDDLQQLFLNWIDGLTPIHLRVLAFFQNPRSYGECKEIQYPNWSMGVPAVVIEHTFKELLGRREIYDQVIADLQQRGLLSKFDAHTTMTTEGMFASRTTEIGNTFLDFIASPIQNIST